LLLEKSAQVDCMDETTVATKGNGVVDDDGRKSNLC
jgi:hypothetical protein